MKNGKDVKITEVPNRDPEIKFDGSEFFMNRLSLADALKDKMRKENLDWRFINASQFRSDGNIHRSHWKPYRLEGADVVTFGANPEGLINRGDLILAVRSTKITQAHKQFLAKRNAAQKSENAVGASELRKMAKAAGVEKEAKIYEGYEEND